MRTCAWWVHWETMGLSGSTRFDGTRESVKAEFQRTMGLFGFTYVGQQPM